MFAVVNRDEGSTVTFALAYYKLGCMTKTHRISLHYRLVNIFLISSSGLQPPDKEYAH